MVTLSDIYSKIQNINYSATSSDHTVSTTSSPTGTFSTLAEIYDALDDLTYTASNIATGTSIMGITGNISVPPVDKVEDGYFYGPNNTLEGTLPAGGATLEWTADLGFGDTYENAVYLASHLEADGVTVSETVQNIWRIPTIAELYKAFGDTYFPGGSGLPGGFVGDGFYWSSTPQLPNWQWICGNLSGFINCAYDFPIAGYSLRCVKI
jgi:hypothetical protein